MGVVLRDDPVPRAPVRLEKTAVTFASFDAQAFALVVAAVGGGVAAVIAALEYGVKVRAEQAETNTKLARVFAELVPIANGRSHAVLSDALAQELVTQGLITREDLETDRADDLLRNAAVNLPVGAATMAATITAIAELGDRHDVLFQPALTALRAMPYLGEDKVCGPPYRAALAALEAKA